MSDSNMPPTNPRWQTAAILKTVKSRYLRNRLIYRDKIGKQMQVAPPDPTESKKKRIFETNMAGGRHLYNGNELIDFRTI